jgi:hypothetical protein
MIPLPAFSWKLVAKIAAVVAVLLILWWVQSRIRVSYQAEAERDAAKAALTQYEAAVTAREKQAAAERARAALRSAGLAVTVAKASGEIDALRNQHVQSVVYREKPSQGGVCRDPRIGPEWVGVWNQTADVASRAVQPAP